MFGSDVDHFDMSQSNTPVSPPSPLPQIGKVTIFDILAALKAGVFDFRRAPQFGLFFSALYALVGWVLVTQGAGHVSWVLTVSLGFPLVAPFAAVGLYEVSRRIEADLPLTWRDVLGVVWRERTRQIPWMGALIAIYFLFWTFLAHMIFAVFMGLSVMRNVTSSVDMFLTPNGLTMVGTEIVIGGALAFLLFSMTVVSLPLLLEKEVDFVTAILLSLKTVTANFGVMVIWAAIIAVLTVAALVPAFLGLLIVLPVLGHATWHLYRRSLYDET